MEGTEWEKKKEKNKENKRAFIRMKQNAMHCNGILRTGIATTRNQRAHTKPIDEREKVNRIRMKRTT